MEFVREEASRTLTIEGSDASGCLDNDSVLLLADSPADARGGVSAWSSFSKRHPNQIATINTAPNDAILVDFRGNTETIKLRDCGGLFDLVGRRPCVLDISGLPFVAWGPIVRDARRQDQELRVAYSEPLKYRWHDSPTSTLFDLSARIGGIKPLPGFAKLGTDIDQPDTLLVVFLGFEGGRARHIAAQFDPQPRTVAVIGLPGYSPEFPQYTVAMNRAFLEQTGGVANTRLAAANSPFEAHGVLSSLVQSLNPGYTVVAPIGTKPHALGALLFCLDNWDSAELYFDNPIARLGRSEGIERIHLFDISE